MAKYDDQLNKMLNLMEDKKAPVRVESSLKYHANGADGKVYGILREGNKFYIKTTESGKENVVESYDYLGGFNERSRHAYKSLNEATKHLENELICLNEAYGKHEKSSVLDMDKHEKAFLNLTEAARVELDRVNQIFENSCKIGTGNIGDPESKGKSTGENTVKNNDPFTEKTNATLDKDPNFNGTVEKATPDDKKVNNVEKDLTSDAKKTANSGSEKDYKDAHDDLDGEGVADKHATGGKAVKMNEAYELYDDNGDVASSLPDEINLGDEEIGAEDFGGEEDINADMEVDGDITADDFDNAENIQGEVGNDVVGQEDDLGTMLENFEKEFCSEETAKEDVEGNKTASVITGPEKTLDGPHGGDGADAKWERIEEEDGNVNEPTKQGNEETMKSFQKKGNLPVQSWDKMDIHEAVTSIVNDVYKKLNESKKPAKKETLQEAIDRIVKEEVTKLNAWGKHPRYRKEPMTTPANKEVLAGTAEKDWNDDSTKGNQPYGQKIGKGDPFDKVVDMLTDQVMANLKESFRK